MELKIERNYYNGGLSCFFKYEGQGYLADLCVVRLGEHQGYTECMIFKSADGSLTFENASHLYCKREIPVTEESLRECIEEFINGLKEQKNGEGDGAI